MKLTQIVDLPNKEQETASPLEAKIVSSQITLQNKEDVEEAIWMEHLPSKYLPYSEKKIYLRGMSYGELKTISRLPEDSNYGYLTRVLEKVCNGFPINKLAPVDLKAILLTVSVLTEETHAINVNSICPICTASNYATVQMEEIEFQELNETHLKMNAGEKELEFRYLTVEDMLYLENIEDHPLQEILTIALMLTKAPPSESENPESFKKEFEAALEEIFNLSSKYTRKLNEIEERLLPDVQSIEQTCISCKSPFRTYLYIDPDILLI